MADQTVKLNLEQNSKYRFAIDLMFCIARAENVKQDREYYLRLYRQCYHSVNGYADIEDVVKAKAATASGVYI